ncbi:MAG: hypothetical protein WDM89_18615 [Rhizomicrobium sp.]
MRSLSTTASESNHIPPYRHTRARADHVRLVRYLLDAKDFVFYVREIVAQGLWRDENDLHA